MGTNFLQFTYGRPAFYARMDAGKNLRHPLTVWNLHPCMRFTSPGLSPNKVVFYVFCDSRRTRLTSAILTVCCTSSTSECFKYSLSRTNLDLSWQSEIADVNFAKQKRLHSQDFKSA